MARPRRWEHGAGRVDALSPTDDLLPMLDRALVAREVIRQRGYWPKDEVGAISEYRTAYHRKLALDSWLAPGSLVALTTRETDYAPDGEWVNVRDGDTLCCACSRVEAAAGRCHRAWSAPFLVRAGWRVLLDGAEVTP